MQRPNISRNDTRTQQLCKIEKWFHICWLLNNHRTSLTLDCFYKYPIIRQEIQIQIRFSEYLLIQVKSNHYNTRFCSAVHIYNIYIWEQGGKSKGGGQGAPTGYMYRENILIKGNVTRRHPVTGTVQRKHPNKGKRNTSSSCFTLIDITCLLKNIRTSIKKRFSRMHRKEMP